MNIVVTDMDGKDHTIEATDGWTLMEIIREAGLPIRADCGGCCACATCHVYVDAAWTDKIEELTDDEDILLDDSFERKDGSRLCCQITFSQKVDGIKVELTQDAVE